MPTIQAMQTHRALIEFWYCSTCAKGKLDCVPQTQVQKIPPNTAPICTNGRVYVSCKAKCVATCSDPSGEPGCENSLAGCKPGCECPKGLCHKLVLLLFICHYMVMMHIIADYSWDVLGYLMDGDKCVEPSQCPCHYNGVAYMEGMTVKQDCKQW